MIYELNSQHVATIAMISVILNKAPDTYTEKEIGWIDY